MQFALKTIRNFFIFTAVLLAFLTLWPLLYPQARYYINSFIGQKFKIETIQSGSEEKQGSDLSPFAQMLQGPPPIKIDPVNKDFSIVIEKINVNAPIVANVSMSDRKQYKEALKDGVAHAKGSAAPGEGATYLFAHSSLDFWELGKYATVFNLLGKSEEGDRIVVFYENKRYDYYVASKETVKGGDITAFYEQSDQPLLYLQTCTPPGTTWNRLIVKAVLK